jgi:predicted O-methyltransferase YrrM
MNPMIWHDVDDYIVSSLIPHDRVLDAVLKANRHNKLPEIEVSPTQGRFLNLLVRISGARLILEIGTLGGYSTIWLARGLPRGGRLVTLEAEPRHASVARENIALAGLSEQVEVRLGRAIDTLPQLYAEGLHPFDLIFIDADKPSNSAYLDWAMRLSRPGTVIVVDNVIRDGSVTDTLSGDASVQGARDAFANMGANRRLTATALQTVGAKGYDGFAIALVGE